MVGKKIYRAVFTVLGLLCGAGAAYLISFIFKIVPKLPKLNDTITAVIFVVCMLAGGIIFFLMAPAVSRRFEKFSQNMDRSLQKVPIRVFVCGTMGLILGLLIAFLISQLWASVTIPLLRIILSVAVYILMGYLGVSIGARKADELTAGFKNLNERNVRGPKGKNKAPAPKILDTSVIIDGRIADIMKTGFLEGQIVIPEFVLVELRHIADSSDSLKRNRGRRGLDILNKIQEQYGIDIYNTEHEKSLKDIEEVDVKLLELAAIMHGKVVTNDYNLNKVAAIKGVQVLNINELANTLKPVVLPGEEMTLTPIKAGKEEGQALAYLDDGTMIVIEDGWHYIGMEITVSVTSVLQTSAGRMIFARKD